jgi:chromosome segregation ATPase
LKKAGEKMSMQSEIKAEQEKILKDHLISDLRRQLADLDAHTKLVERSNFDLISEKAELEKQLAAKDKEIEQLKKLLDAVIPKYSHDHDYWHDDCGMCRMDKDRYERIMNP